MNRMLASGVLCCLLVLLVACGGTRPLPEERYFELPSQLSACAETRPTFSDDLALEELRTDALRAQRPMLAGRGDRPGELRQYHYHFWVDAPARLVQRRMQDFLGHCTDAASVLDVRIAPRGALRLRGELIQFEELRTEQATRVQVALHLQVQADRERRPLLNRRYRAERHSAAGTDAAALVPLYDAALNEILRAFVSDLDLALGAGPQNPKD